MTDREERFQAYVESTLEALTPCAGGLIVSRGSDLVTEHYFPTTATAPLPVTVDADARWYIFSVTKSFAAALLLNLATEGVLALDDPVVRYLPNFAADDTAVIGNHDHSRVTLRHLASHTSGVALPEGMELWEQRAAVDLRRVAVVANPGEVFEYSQLGMVILELAIEAATGRDFGAEMRTRILEPLGLRDTRYVYEEAVDLPLVPIESGSPTTPQRVTHTAPRLGRVGTGLYTTARDLTRFGRLWLNRGRYEGHTYFSPEKVREAWRHHGTRASDHGRYGLLWWLFEDDGGYVMSGAAHTLCAVVPATDTVVTVMRNHLGPHPGDYDYYEDKRAAVQFAGKVTS